MMRELPFLKIHLIAIIWVFTVGVFPLLNESNFELNNWLLAITNYFYIVAICIPFDIRDVQLDDASQKTIPQIVGVSSAKMLGMLLLVVFLISVSILNESLSGDFLFLVAIIVQVSLVYFTARTNKDYYYGGLIDGAIALLGIAYLLS